MENLVNIESSFWKDKRVLLTGHTGFKGSWLSLWLLTLGADVWGYSLESSEKHLFKKLKFDCPKIPNDLGSINSKYADIRDFDSIKQFVVDAQPEIVFHLAAQPLVRTSYRDPRGTWDINVNGTLNLLEALKSLKSFCAVVLITTDKVYENKNWDFGYRENDVLGGYDPYSASKAAAEIAIASWRSSFCGDAIYQTPYLGISTARSGNVIGGGDWSEDRIIPDAIKALEFSKPIMIRSPNSIRPWQHVLEPLSGYLCLAQKIFESFSFKNSLTSAFNFGPKQEENHNVQQVVEEILKYWKGEFKISSNPNEPYEAKNLRLHIEKANNLLSWYPRWSFQKSIERTIKWYKAVSQGEFPISACILDLRDYEESDNGN